MQQHLKKVKILLFEVFIFVFAYSGSILSVETTTLCEQIVEENRSVCVKIPEKQLANKSLQIAMRQNNPYVNWTDEDADPINYFKTLKEAKAFRTKTIKQKDVVEAGVYKRV